MKPIDVRPQHRLPLARTFGLCTKGIRHRLFRSLLTMMVIVLAVAFFMNLVVDSVFAKAVDRGVAIETGLARRSAVAADLWFGRPSPTVLGQRLVAAADGGPAMAAYGEVSGFPGPRLSALVAALRAERDLFGYLDRLDSGSRAMLIRRVRNDELLAWLADGDHWTAFTQGVARIRSQRLPMTLDQARTVVTGAKSTHQELAAFAAAWNGRIDSLSTAIRGLTGAADREGAIAWLAKADRPGLDGFSRILAGNGFAQLYPPALVADLQEDFRLDGLRDAVIARLSGDECRKRWVEAYRQQAPLDDKLLMLGDRKALAVVGEPFTADQLQRIAASADHDRTLAAREKALAGKVDPAGGLLSARQGFLVAISFVVCMVGIANAMLMAITERFREIATMKCLGATDGFILTQFLMEAGIQGTVGGAIGTVVGLALSLVKGLWLYGGHLVWYFPIIVTILCVVICILAGLLLATLASIYPSWMASRMAPMEAMRVE